MVFITSHRAEGRVKIARLMMTTVLVLGSVLSFALDWSGNHLLSPLWHAHARFHGALLLFFLAGVSLTGVWMMWRRSLEPGLAVRISALVAVAYWTPLFYVPFVLPSASWWAGKPGAEIRLGGMIVYPNLVVAGLFLVVTGLAAWLSREAAPTEARAMVRGGHGFTEGQSS